MAERWYVRAARGLVSVSIVVAVLAQYRHEFASPEFSTVHYFSHFTMLSNIFAAVLFGALAIAPRWAGPNESWTRGAITIYLVTTGLVFALLLADTNTTMLPWANLILHQLMPMLMVLDWLVVRPHRVRLGSAVLWLGFPLVYLAYTLVLGAITGWYPYPFLDPATAGGTLGVLIYVVTMFAAVLVGSLLLAAVGNIGNRHEPAFSTRDSVDLVG